MRTEALHAQVLIIGGGAAGISVAARMRRAGKTDVAVIEPSPVHYYQPAFTLVGGGIVSAKSTVRTEASVMPKGVQWVRSSAARVEPDTKIVVLQDGRRISYEVLILATGLQLDWDAIPGLPEAMLTPAVSSNYSHDTASKTWDMIRSMRGGAAVFTMAAGAVKCPSAAQKIAYLAADHWRRQGLLDKIRITLVLPMPRIYKLPEFSDVLDQVAAGYGIEVKVQSEMIAVDPVRKVIKVADLTTLGTPYDLSYDLLHVVPPQKAVGWIDESGLSDAVCGGFVDVDQQTLQHKRYREIFAIGDNTNTPNGKTGSAVRMQAPVVTANAIAVLNGAPVSAQYNGYAACPITTARNKVFLAEGDYVNRPASTIPFMGKLKPRRSLWLMKRYALAPLYWHGMLRGRA